MSKNTHEFSGVLGRVLRVLTLESRTLLMSIFTRVLSQFFVVVILCVCISFLLFFMFLFPFQLLSLFIFSLIFLSLLSKCSFFLDIRWSLTSLHLNMVLIVLLAYPMSGSMSTQSFPWEGGGVSVNRCHIMTQTYSQCS